MDICGFPPTPLCEGDVLTPSTAPPQTYLLPGPCRTSEELKYTMIRLFVDGVDLFVVEQGCAANVKVDDSDAPAVQPGCSLPLLIWL